MSGKERKNERVSVCALRRSCILSHRHTDAHYHTPTQTFTQTHTHAHKHKCAYTLLHILLHTLSQERSHTYIITDYHALSHTSHTVSHIHTHTDTYTRYHTLSHDHTHTLSHDHKHTLYTPMAHTPSHTHPMTHTITHTDYDTHTIIQYTPRFARAVCRRRQKRSVGQRCVGRPAAWAARSATSRGIAPQVFTNAVVAQAGARG